MKQIVIAQRGWVFVGDVERTENEVVIKNAKNIRRWGTSRGLGELAQNGPQHEHRAGRLRHRTHAPAGRRRHPRLRGIEVERALIDTEACATSHSYSYGDGY